jgi:SagB-type dehydrogenase family enzyme
MIKSFGLVQMPDIIKLPLPQKSFDFPLIKALEMRRSKRKWGNEPLSIQEISNILWCACGITQVETPRSKSKRTAPSVTNSQSIKIYVALENGLFLYEEKHHHLVLVLEDDIRNNIGTQKMMHSAPVCLIYVADFLKMKSYLAKDINRKWFVSGTDTGFISQNVYLYCAAANLSTVILGLINRDKLHEIMHLSESENVIYSQVIGKNIDNKS